MDTDLKIIFPNELQGWEYETKGWMAELVVEYQYISNVFEVYDKVRFIQTMEDELKNKFVHLENILIVERVTKDCIEKTIRELYKSN